MSDGDEVADGTDPLDGTDRGYPGELEGGTLEPDPGQESADPAPADDEEPIDPSDDAEDGEESDLDFEEGATQASCGCASTGTHPAAWAALLIGLALARRRR